MSVTWQAGDWALLNDRLVAGKVAPVLGAGASIGVIGSAAELAVELAAATKLPFPTTGGLDRVAQYASIDRDVPGEAIKEIFAGRLKNLRVGDIADPHDVYKYLTGLGIPLWLTTNYDDLIKRGLAYHNKVATVSVALWTPPELYWDNERYALGDWEPSADKPLVYHLHGCYDDERSMVISERDYLDYLEQMAADQSKLLAKCVRTCLANSSLLFIGYGFTDPNFHLLLRQWQTPKQCYAVQPAPFAPGEQLDAYTDRYERRLRELTGTSIKVFWGTASEFCAEHERETG